MIRVDVKGLVKEVYSTPGSSMKAYFGENKAELDLLKELDSESKELSVENIQSAKSISEAAKERARFKYGFVQALKEDKEKLNALYNCKEPSVLINAAQAIINRAAMIGECSLESDYLNPEIAGLNPMYLKYAGLAKKDISTMINKGCINIELMARSYWYNEHIRSKYLDDVLSKGIDNLLKMIFEFKGIKGREVVHRRANGETLENIANDLGISKQAVGVKDKSVKEKYIDICIDVLKYLCKDRAFISDSEVAKHFEDSQYLNNKDLNVFNYVLKDFRIDGLNGFINGIEDKDKIKLVIDHVKKVIDTNIIREDIEYKIADIILKNDLADSVNVDDLLSCFTDNCFVSDYIILGRTSSGLRITRSRVLRYIVEKYYNNYVSNSANIGDITAKINILMGRGVYESGSRYDKLFIQRRFTIADGGFAQGVEVSDTVKKKVNKLLTEFAEKVPGLYITFNAAFDKYRAEFKELGITDGRSLHGIFKEANNNDKIVLKNFTFGCVDSDGKLLPMRKYIEKQSRLTGKPFDIESLADNGYIEKKLICAYTHSDELIRYSRYRFMATKNINWSPEEKKLFNDTLDLYLFANVLANRDSLFNMLKQTECGEFIEKYDIQNVNEFRQFIKVNSSKDISDVF